MERAKVIQASEAYLQKNWPAMVEDIAHLVEVPSIQELDAAQEGAPFGPGPKAALEEALKIARNLGFETKNVDGYMGCVDLAGETDTQIGLIGHVDVVPAGTGWHFDPYTVSIKDDYLVGRGVLDDKGPTMIALHAMKCLSELCPNRRYTIRFLLGTNEESGMGDVAYYRERYADPAFLFTPDAEFPVCYGEKGGFDAVITSKTIADGMIVEFEGGCATNAVPGFAHAVVKRDAADLPEAADIKLAFVEEGMARIDAVGKNAHAAMPEEGKSAIAILVNYLLANDLCNDDERTFLTFQKKLVDYNDGEGLGIKTSDEYFGPLTVVGGTVKLEDGHIIQTLDARFPTSITPDDMLAALHALCDPIDATVENTLLLEPFLIDPESPEIQALIKAYNTVTGQDRKPFTIGGGTYAREFSRAASFGPEMPWLETPDWVGCIHGPDEAVSIELLQTAFKIYTLALFDLQHLDLK